MSGQRRFQVFFIWLSLALFVPLNFATSALKKPVYAAIVVDHRTNKVLHSENANQITYPASLTKMMTLYLLFEALQAKRVRLATRMHVSKYAANRPPSKLGLQAGQKITVQDAMLALMVKSANDAAVVLAEHLGKTEKEFAALMTQKARALGMRHTTFKNASGLPHREQVTTAQDMCILAQALYRKFPAYYRYFKTKSFLYNGQKYRSHNRLIGKCHGVDGIKTGFINASGFNVATSARRENTRLFAVVLGGATGKWRDNRMEQLLNSYFPQALNAGKERPRKSAPAAKEIMTFVPPTKPLILQGPDEPQDAIATLLLNESYSLTPLEAEPFKTVTDVDHDVAPSSVDLSWAAQFGAFRDEQQAQEKADLLVTLIPNLPGTVTITPSPDRRTPLYRTRLVGLSKPDAETVCKKLRFHEIPCLPLKNRD
jgi:D-alanyl-D-alanine carboxypeptidase